MGLWQSVLDAIYPPTCAMCDRETVETGQLCAECWSATPFIRGCVCDLCGAPLPGEADADTMMRCDSCLTIGRPWSRGRAALLYAGGARGFVLRLKHADRLDLVDPAARWMAQAGAAIWPPAPLLVPVPAHWTRRVKRRYNQAALLARALARQTGAEVEPQALIRSRRTSIMEGKGLAQRFAEVEGAIRPHPTRGAAMAERSVIIVDDVLTSGATLAASTEAALEGGARDVRVLALARVVRDH
jgi:predicted amidophosphoribosyltransferase